jgi:hypothetical protein
VPSFYAFAQAAVTLPASIYGLGEYACGDVGKPVPCAEGATTASGEPFDPRAVTAAVFLPAPYRARPHAVRVKVHGRPCVTLWLNDKGNPRYTGVRGFDLTPAAFEALTGQKAKPWSSLPKLQLCEET